MVKIRSRKVKPIFLLALLLSLVMLSKGVTDNDNFIIFTEDIGGFPVPATDGNTYFIGTNISKVSLSSRIVSNVIEIYSSDLATKINFDGGALTGDQSVLVVHPVGGGGPNCFELVTITTSDMQLRQDNCLKILSDNIFGPKIYMIKRDPSNNTIFYGVGYHIDYIANVDTGIVIQFQVLDTYAISMLNFKKVNSSFKTTGTTKGWNSLDFDSTATNIALSGLLKSGSTTYCSVLSISKSLSKFNWMKYFKVKSTSSLVLTYKEVKSYYDSSTNSLISVVFSSNSYSTYYTLINIFSLSMTDGSTNWSNQFIDYGSANFATIRSVINPFYGELSLYFSDSNYKYYSIQSISLKNGTMLTNMQVEIFKHYQLDNIVVFPNQTSGTSSSDLLICPITGYIMKMNTRKANLDIIDKTSLFRPLYSINYNNFTLPTTSPVDLEAVSYSPASDFFYSETSYEIESLAYTYKKGSIPTLQLATDMMIYFSNTTDNVSVPNNSEFTLNQAHTKDNLMDAYISLTFQLYNITNLSTPLGSDAYELIRSGNTYKVKIKNIKSGTFYAKATASQGGFYTYYDFTLVVRCTNNCDLCSNIDTCDVCSSGYVLDYQSQCQSTNASMIDSNVVQGLVASAMLSILALGALQMQINSNLWVFVNTLQILRTILLLKINLPLSVRDMINSSTALSTFDFGVTNKVVPDPSSSIQIDQIMNGDNVLAQYFNDYGIQSYRFMEFVESLFFDTLCLFLASTLLIVLLSLVYLKIRKRSLKPIKDKIIYVFLFNGFVRIYFENLLDGMIYALVNLRSLKFVDYVDAFSYLFMSAFIVFCIFFTVFFIIYAKFTPIEKWSAKIREILNETNEKTRGILFYHLIFTFRRLILTINVILLGVFPANVHISIHAVSQLIVFLMFCFIPMYETRFQKVSNLIMESCNTFVFFSAYYFQNSDHSSVLSMIVMAYILLSQFAILILTFSKGIKDIVLWYQSKKKQVVSASSIMTEKSVMGKVIEDASPNYLHTNSASLKPIQEDVELEIGYKKKMPMEEMKIGEGVLPMRYISQFEEMGEDKDLDEKIKDVHQKIFNNPDLSGTKKTKLGKLLQNMRKKKLMKIKKKKDHPDDKITEVTKELTSMKSNTKSYFDESSKKKSSGESGDSMEDQNKDEQESPKFERSETFADPNKEDMRSSKISIFSHNYPPLDEEIRRSSEKSNSNEDKSIKIVKTSEEESVSKGSSKEENKSSDDKSSNPDIEELHHNSHPSYRKANSKDSN